MHTTLIAQPPVQPIDHPILTRLSRADAPRLAALYAQVHAQTPDGFLRPRETAAFTDYLTDRSQAVFGHFVGRVLVSAGFLSMLSADASSDWPPFPCIPAKQWPRRAALVETAIVHPAYRGRGLQRALILARTRHAFGAGKSFACAGVHLNNLASWINLLRCDFHIVGKHGEVIALLRPKKRMHLLTRADDVRLFSQSDVRAHEQAIADSYIGVAAQGGDVRYERLR